MRSAIAILHIGNHIEDNTMQALAVALLGVYLPIK